MEFLQCAIAPWIALCNSSIDDDSELYDEEEEDPPHVPVPNCLLISVTPLRDKTPEWFGELRIEDGQLETQLFRLGYLRFPENECEVVPPLLSFDLVFSFEHPIWDEFVVINIVEALEGVVVPCFWDNFS